MPAIVPGYEYDIFISYRQKDNRSDQWVTQFVQALKEELDATFKEDISVYFDENPHDGLHDTHDVDDSLKEKVKCLIFIPIVSRTYCDPKSFAWQKEFLPFLQFAKTDKHGLKVKLTNGNVTSRVLPVRIHDLDTEDVELFENETGSVIRSIDFVYSSTGVNRPLRPQDDDKLYRDQTNKVGNAIKEIIAAMKNPVPQNKEYSVEERETYFNEAKKENRKRIPVWGYIMAVMIVVAGVLYFSLPMFQSSETVEIDKNLPKTLVVLPFEDQSAGDDYAWFASGLRTELMLNLGKLSTLTLKGQESAAILYKQGLLPQRIGDSLNVNFVLTGSFRRDTERLRIIVSLISVHDGRQIWTNAYDEKTSDHIELQIALAEKVATELLGEISEQDRSSIRKGKTENPEAFDFYLRARYISEKLVWGGTLKKEDFKEAEKLYLQSIQNDSTFAMSHAGLAHLYAIYESLIYFYEDVEDKNLYKDKAKQAIDIAYQLDPSSDYVNAAMGYVYHILGDLPFAVKKTMAAIKINPENPFNWDILGFNFCYGLGLSEKGISAYEYITKLDPLYEGYWGLAQQSRSIGNFLKAKKYVNEGLKIYPNHLGLLLEQVYVAVMMNDLETAKNALKKATAINKDFAWIPRHQSHYYAAVGNKQKALQYHKNSTTYLLLNMNEDAIKELISKDFLQKNILIRSGFLYLNNNPIYNPIRNDSRFITLLEQEKEKYDRNMETYGTLFEELRPLMTRK